MMPFRICPALGIVGERRKELCAVERSTEANAEPRKARPPQDRTVKNSHVFCSLACGGNAQIKKKTKSYLLTIVSQTWSCIVYYNKQNTNL